MNNIPKLNNKVSLLEASLRNFKNNIISVAF